MHPHRILFVLEVCALIVVVFSAMRWPRPNPASAAFPGANGMIAFTRWVDGNAEVARAAAGRQAPALVPAVEVNYER